MKLSPQKTHKLLICIVLSLLFVACDNKPTNQAEPFYGETKPPKLQEFRWSNGKLPTTIDPAFASASPETDVVRAVFDCLTELDGKTLKPQKSLAIDWKSDEDFKTWTFQIRKDAKWSNGEVVTAKDFVRSWKRLATLSDKVSHQILLKNIVGMNVTQIIEKSDIFTDETDNKEIEQRSTSVKISKNEVKSLEKFGAEAIGNFTLKVTLIEPDDDFPSLVANPMFAAIYADNEFSSDKLNAGITTNGAFRITSIGVDGITLDRSKDYWDKDNVLLNRIKFIPIESAENALQAYKKGEIDVLTNFHFEPLALKLLKPFDEFHRTKHNAINIYEFNLLQKPFNDVRVREALAISIDRQRLTDDEMDGATEPAFAFSIFNTSRPFRFNAEKARKLFSAANFDNGENFPTIRLIINRNDMQKRVAKAVAAMWKKNLNVDTEIIVKENAEIELAKTTGEFDLIRRGLVLPTTNEKTNLLAIFPDRYKPNKKDEIIESSNLENIASNQNIDNSNTDNLDDSEEKSEPDIEIKPIVNEVNAIAEIPAIPLYFPESYSLVKPYIQGFETNVLDAPSLKTVKIDENWQPEKPKNETKTLQSVF